MAPRSRATEAYFFVRAASLPLPAADPISRVEERRLPPVSASLAYSASAPKAKAAAEKSTNIQTGGTKSATAVRK